jgi:tRNA(Ile)-lysidine synthase
LALAHHLEDQAETFLLRLGRGSGLDGLAAMAPVSETSGLRLLRPLLDLPKARLQAALEARGLAWVDDPSNRDGAYARVRLRRLLPELAGEGLTPARLGGASHHLGRARAALEGDVAALLARAARPDPAGFCRSRSRGAGRRQRRGIAPRPGALPDGGRRLRLSRRAWSGWNACTRAWGRSLARAVTLGGCRVVPRGTRWLIVREAGRTAPTALPPDGRLLWDGRFEVALGPEGAGRSTAANGEMTVGPLGSAGWRTLAAALERAGAGQRAACIPAPARAALPALRDADGLAAVPPLGYFRDGKAAERLKVCRFAPANGLTSPAFTVV